MFQVGAHTFLELFDAYPDTQSVFPKFRGEDISFSPELAKHGSRVMLIVDKVIANIDNNDRIWELLTNMGRKHFRKGACSEHFSRDSRNLSFQIMEPCPCTWS